MLEVSRMTDVNHQEYSKAAIQCTRFHSNAAVVLTAGLDKSLRLFQVDGKENTKIQSVFFKDMPIMSADFRYVKAPTLLSFICLATLCEKFVIGISQILHSIVGTPLTFYSCYYPPAPTARTYSYLDGGRSSMRTTCKRAWLTRSIGCKVRYPSVAQSIPTTTTISL